jgi:hypothetical protein
LFSCSNEEVIYFYSFDRSTCVTIIDNNEFRYVIAGKVTEVTKSGYAKLSTKNIDSLGDGIWICWLDSNKWEMIIYEAEIITNRLDSSKYSLDTKLPEDERGIPHERKFRQNNCAVFSFHLMRLSPNEGAIVETQ